MTPPRRVACLHTAASNVAIFEEAATGLNLDLHHIVRADLLAAAIEAGDLDTAVIRDTETVLRDAAKGADFVLLACSTLGPIADRITSPVPMLRIDRALAELAVAVAAAAPGGRVVVLYTFPGTRQATEELFCEVASGTNAIIDMQLVAGAWDLFQVGDQQRYGAVIAAAADDALAAGAASIAFAQASMAPAVALCRAAKPLTSPQAALRAALPVASSHS